MDAVQLEINPLVETKEGEVVAVDAKIQFDDNAQFRQAQIFKLDETSEMDPREVKATQHHLNYVGLDGNIGCLGNYYYSFYECTRVNLEEQFHCGLMKLNL